MSQLFPSWLALFLCCLYSIVAISDLTLPAFCTSSSSKTSWPHPTPQSKRYLPWIWDAVHDPMHSMVDILVISQSTCDFNISRWKQLISLFPQYKSQLANGDANNIIVHTNNTDERSWDISKAFDNNWWNVYINMTCMFYDGSKAIGQFAALKVETNLNAVQLGNMKIKCPIPKELQSKMWDRIQLHRHISTKEMTRYKAKLFDHPISLRTPIVPVCRLPVSKTRRKYDISICTALDHGRVNEIVEWIEYHKLQGIAHFYLYINTHSGSQLTFATLSKALQRYVKEGIATLISWPYEHCVKGMSSGRWVQYYYGDSLKQALQRYPELEDEVNSTAFLPPGGIALAAAMGSCYNRFRHTSQYMLAIDSDEFVMVNATYHTKPKPFLRFVNDIFQKYPKAPALYILPTMVLNCSVDAKDVIPTANYNLPRIGKFTHAKRGPRHEGKLLMRSKAVETFNIHYLSSFSDGKWKYKNHVIGLRRDVELLHIRNADTSIFGAVLPFTNYVKDEMCNNSYTYHIQLQEKYYGEKDRLLGRSKKRKFVRHALSDDFLKKLEYNYQFYVNM